MKAVKRLTTLAASLAVAITAPITAPVSSYADDQKIEIIPETGDTEVIISTDGVRTQISPYIYGISDTVDISGISPTALKQKSTALSSYNWETNYSNSGAAGANSNDFSLVESYSPGNWSVPALAAYSLNSRAKRYGIPMRLVTLQMMGYAAKDSMGIVSNDALSRNMRWCRVSFQKDGAYLTQPDTSDDTVYIDEYVSYLVNRYGAADDGGINGYFLDSEPDKWTENFPVLGLEKITPSELVDRSARLSSAVRSIDGQALIFGPSLSGLQGCINLDNPEAWNECADEDNEYSWFIDYYLGEMQKKSREAGYRLLDVLDAHYYTEAMTPMGVPVLTGDDDYSNAYRMQAVKTLWDPDYTENSVTVLMNKQFTPLISTLNASVRINYPDTKLSFSEYDFGGGGNISGAAAEADVLGVFAREGVYLACLSPVSEDIRFQKAAMKLYTDYDGEGSGFGDMLIPSDNGGDSMSSVYAAADSSDPQKLRVILINKNMVNTKRFILGIRSEEYDYELEAAYTIDKDSAEIIPVDMEIFDMSESGSMSFEADTVGVYMLVFDGAREEPEEDITDASGEVWVTSQAETVSEPSQTETGESVTEEPVFIDGSDNVSDISVSLTETEEALHGSSVDTEESTAAAEDPTEEAPEVSDVTAATSVTVSEAEEDLTDSSDEEILSEDPPEEGRTVAAPIRIIVSILAATVGLGVVYILVFDRR